MSTPQSLTDKLKSLGVQVGAHNLPPPQPRQVWPVEAIAPGRLISTPGGETFAAESFYGGDFLYGRSPLSSAAPLTVIADWAGQPDILACPLESFAFLDIETTGLSGGAGTYAFMVGIGRVEDGRFRLAQFFLREPAEEAAHLLAVEEFLAPCQTLVTFNGKSFDAPLLTTRYLNQGWKSPLASLYHVDLLHLARRLWRQRLPSRTLGNLEVHILGAHRTQEDIPGWLVPQMYVEYLHTGDARPLSGVFYHNAMDVLAMAALLHHTAHFLADPLAAADAPETDLIAAARLYEDLGRLDEAVTLYREGLGRPLPDDLWDETVYQLSFIHKRRGEWEPAMALWRVAAKRGGVYACVELAKVCEHELRDYDNALAWTQRALEVVRAPNFSRVERATWQAELEHRQKRLRAKLG